MQDKGYSEALTSILLGYSVCQYKEKKIFIKHFGYTDSIETDYHYNLAYESAISKKIPNQEEKIELLKSQGLWSDKKDQEIKNLDLKISHAKKTKSKTFLPSQIEEISKKIKEDEDKVLKLVDKKRKLIGVTAELIAQQRADDFYIYSSFFSDKNLENLLIKESFDSVDSELLNDLKLIYFSAMKNIKNGGIKRIALTREFQDLMHVTENVYEILGKPYVKYSFFQIDLVTLGRFYKMILCSNPPPPDNLRYQPDKLEEWWNTSQNAKKVLSKRGKESMGGGDTVFGATAEDMKKMFGDGENVINLDTEIKKKSVNGMVPMNELMKIHGIKT